MPKPQNPGYVPGDQWVHCDVCGFNYRSSEMRHTWDNLVVCRFDFEVRHPQDFVRGRQDKIAAEGTVRPEPTDTFVSVTFAGNGTVPDGTIDNSL